ncbi:unnamed protein product [Discosporangium mesarthrocarpum]
MGKVTLWRWDNSCDPVAHWEGRLHLPGPGSFRLFQRHVDELEALSGQERFIVHFEFQATEERRDSAAEEAATPGATNGARAGNEQVELHRGVGVTYVSTGSQEGVPLSPASLPDPQLEWRVVPGVDPNKWETPSVLLKARAHAAHVHLELEPPPPADTGKTDSYTSTRSPSVSGSGSHSLPFFFRLNDNAFHALPCREYVWEVLGDAGVGASGEKGWGSWGSDWNWEDSGRDGVRVRVMSLRELLMSVDMGVPPPEP